MPPYVIPEEIPLQDIPTETMKMQARIDGLETEVTNLKRDLEDCRSIRNAAAVEHSNESRRLQQEISDLKLKEVTIWDVNKWLNTHIDKLCLTTPKGVFSVDKVILCVQDEDFLFVGKPVE